MHGRKRLARLKLAVDAPVALLTVLKAPAEGDHVGAVARHGTAHERGANERGRALRRQRVSSTGQKGEENQVASCAVPCRATAPT